VDIYLIQTNDLWNWIIGTLNALHADSYPMAATSPKLNSKRMLPPTATPLVARGATARSAASPRLSTFNPATTPRRTPAKSASPTPLVNGESHEALSASLKLETDHKEQVCLLPSFLGPEINYHQLLLRLQDKDQLISNYVTENHNLTSSLTAADTRLSELYAEQSRWEMELAQRIDISEKLRDQVRDLEKEKRDIQRRYNEQVGNSTGNPASFLKHLLDRYLRRRATGFL
jgi:hypothetical protein